MDALSIFALVLLLGSFIAISYGIIAIHDIPYKIAVARNHPHAEAIHCAGWVSLFLLHAIWPLLWIWATLYEPKKGYGFASGESASSPDEVTPERLKSLEQRLSKLENQPPS